MKRPLIAGAVVSILLLTAGAYVGRLLGPGSRARFPSSFAAEPEGLLAFRRLLEELGLPTGILKQPWGQLRDEVDGVLLVATPLQRPVSRDEKEALEAWLVKGGALLVVDDATAQERTRMLDRLMEEAGLGRNPPLAELDMQTLMPGRPDTAESSGTAARPSGRELGRLMLHSEGRFRDEFRGIPLALNDEGAIVAAEASLGRGRIVRVLGPILATDQLPVGDNLEFGLRLVEDLRGAGPVRFDEFHHGYGGVLPRFREFERSAVAWTFLQGLIVVMVYALARGIRFGPPRLVPEPQRRSSLEFVYSMASLYRRAGFRRYMLNQMLSRFARGARARWELEESLSPSELARPVSRRTAVPEERIARTLEMVEKSAMNPRLGEREMLARARELARLEQEVFGGSGTAA